MSVPDQHIHHEATAEAAKTVAKHLDPQELVFYSGWFCPFVQRSWITLEERGIPYQYKEVNPYKKEPHFLAINPKGLVPAVEYKGKALYESLVICEFLEDAYPSHTPHLLPEDPYDRAIARIWIDFVGKSFLPAFFRLLQSQEKEKQDEARKDLYAALGQLSSKRKGPYFFGNDFTLVDVAIAPWAARDYILVENRNYKREDVENGWKDWAEALEARDSVKKTTSDKIHYAQIYARYLANEAQSEAAKAIRAGRPIP